MLEHNDCPKPAQIALPKRIIEVPNDLAIAPKLYLSNGDMGSYVVLTHCWGGSNIN